jgi:hypothetical protein
VRIKNADIQSGLTEIFQVEIHQAGVIALILFGEEAKVAFWNQQEYLAPGVEI